MKSPTKSGSRISKYEYFNRLLGTQTQDASPHCPPAFRLAPVLRHRQSPVVIHGAPNQPMPRAKTENARSATTTKLSFGFEFGITAAASLHARAALRAAS